MMAMWTCEEHGTDVVVVYYGRSNCPVCATIAGLESEKATLESKIEELESKLDDAQDRVAELEAGQ